MRSHRLAVESLAKSPILLTCTSLLILLWAGVWAPLVVAQTWTTLPGAAVDIGANAAGVVWVVGTSPVAGGYAIWRWNNGSWQNIPGGALRISVDTDGTAWIVNNTHTIFHSNANGQWTTVPGGATDIGVGANGDVWIIGSNQAGNDYDIWHAVFTSGTRTVTGWQKVDGGAVRIAVDQNGNPWVVNSAGMIFQRQGSAWRQMPGTATDITVGPDGEAYVVGTNPSGSGGSAVYRWKDSNWAQVGVMGANVAAGRAGTIYVTQDRSTQYAILSTTGLPQTVGSSTAAAATNTGSAGLQAFDFCWKNTHGRGAGSPLSTSSSDCPAGTVKDPTGLLCYPPCKPGYSMVGPVCWQQCPPGFTDTGADCAKPAPYGNGAGYVNWDHDKCVRENPQGCFENATMWYPNCKANFHNVGGNTCSPNCPSGMPDTGAFCHKNSYGNGVGETLGCAPGLEKSGLLCYPSCGANSDGVGPECWDRCPATWVQCGMGCAKDSSACASATTDQIISVLSAAATIASEVLTAGATAGIKEAGSAVDQLGFKTGEAINKTSKAAEAASDMVSKLKLAEAVKNFPTEGIDKATVAKSVVASMKPTKLTVATKAVDVAGDASTLISTMVGISNDSNLTADQKNFQIAQAVLQTASLVDPTGIMGVVAAYTKPLCSLVSTSQPAPGKFNFDLDSADREKVSLEIAGNE